jgi:hypothetical protein
VLDRLTDQAHIIETGSESYASGEPSGRRQKTKPGCSVLLPLRPSGYAPAEPSTPNLNVPQGGPKQTAASGPSQVAKLKRGGVLQPSRRAEEVAPVATRLQPPSPHSALEDRTPASFAATCAAAAALRVPELAPGHEARRPRRR